MVRHIYIVEDEERLLDEAYRELQVLYDIHLQADRQGEIQEKREFPYRLRRVDLPHANERKYWNKLEITTNDTVVLDLNFNNYRDIHTREKRVVDFTGKDVLKVLEAEKRKRSLPGLERVLVATSLPLEVDSANPAAFYVGIQGFDLYGMEKGRDIQGRVIGYGRSLAERLVALYSDFARFDEQPLNEGWRNE